MDEWRSVYDDPPDWRDDVRLVDLRSGHAPHITARGGFDVGFNGADEFPILRLERADTGETLSFFEFDEWRTHYDDEAGDG